MSDKLAGGSQHSLHTVAPREQAGAQTGDRYEYQYEQAAVDALEVLDDTNVICVYCEWHDDYVLEGANLVAYRFHQVKTRTASKGPWTVGAFFGTGKKKTASPDSIFAKMYTHLINFGDRCDAFVFVTDAGIKPDFEKLVKDARSTSEPANLPDTSHKLFESLLKKFTSLSPVPSPEQFFNFLHRFDVRDGVGKVGDTRNNRTLLGGRIVDLSEVELSIPEARKIGSNLVSLVRDRSHTVLDSPPKTNEQLRREKGLVLDDVLDILSLSREGYRELKQHGRASVVTLSRLHRLCQRSDIPEHLIPDMCRMKALWEAWWVAERHRIDQLSFLALKKECGDALLLHGANGPLTLEGLSEQAKQLAATFRGSLTSSEPLTGELVFGLILSVATEAAR
ncbi:MAG: dsDNA nuclease domain-containing protein [Polyangiaceae bacterium]